MLHHVCLVNGTKSFANLLSLGTLERLSTGICDAAVIYEKPVYLVHNAPIALGLVWDFFRTTGTAGS